MEATTENSSRDRETDAAGARGLINLVFAALPVLACLLGGATQKWSEGIIVALLGLYLLFAPPRVSLGLATNLVLLAFFGLTLLGFVPSHYFFASTWRAAMLHDLNIALPATLSAQPWISGSCVVSVV